MSELEKLELELIRMALERIADASQRHADALQNSNFLMLLGMGAIDGNSIQAKAALARTVQGVLHQLGIQHEREHGEITARMAKAGAKPQ